MGHENTVSIYLGRWRIWGEPMKSAISTPCGPFGLFRKTSNVNGMDLGLFGINDDGIGVPAPDKVIFEPQADPPAEPPPPSES